MKMYVYRNPAATMQGPRTADETPDQFDLSWMISAVLQRRKLLIILPLIFMAIATIFVLVRPSSYTASTQLQLTNLRLTFVREDAFFAETQPDPSFLETQLQIIRSDRVAMTVLTNLKMISAEASAADRAEALERLRRGFSVDRAGLSNVVQIQYTARDPDQAARVANEFARAYSADQNAARFDAAQSGSSWLRERLREVGPKARVIAEALPPQHKSNIRGILIIGVAGVIGGVVAAAGAILWRFFDPRVVTPEEANAATGAQFLGVIPKLPSSSKESDSKPTDSGKSEADGQNKNFRAQSSTLSYAVDHPLSETSRTLQNVEAACRDRLDGKGTRFIGVTSTFAGEGRSVVASNLAFLLAASHKRVLLVDGNFHCRTLTRTFSRDDRAGLIEALRNDKIALARQVIIENRTKLHFLPTGNVRNGQAISLWSDGMRRVFDEAAKAYDYVIFDLPGLGDSGDIRSAAHFIEGFLLVIGWCQATPANIKAGLAAAGISPERIIGTVLNNVDEAETRWVLSPQLAFARMQRSADMPQAG